jgi:hypothetical protein
VREDGAALRMITASMNGLTGGEPIRLLRFGYVAQDEAADPTSALDVSVTVGAGGVVREVSVSCGQCEVGGERIELDVRRRLRQARPDSGAGRTCERAVPRGRLRPSK